LCEREKRTKRITLGRRKDRSGGEGGATEPGRKLHHVVSCRAKNHRKYEKKETQRKSGERIEKAAVHDLHIKKTAQRDLLSGSYVKKLKE